MVTICFVVVIMDETQDQTPMMDPPADGSSATSPTRLNAVELGAKRGIGPLSPLGGRAWHGESRPCVSCGQLVRRTVEVCDQCGQDMSRAMVEKMQALSGPWYVLEHIRPFPGVMLSRLIRQVRRGVLTKTTIVRGPSTYHQWRFAAETPILSKYLGCCWSCQAEVEHTDRMCPVCRADLDAGFQHDGTIADDHSEAPSEGQSAEIRRLTKALDTVSPDQLSRNGLVRANKSTFWIVVGLLLLAIVAVYIMVQLRNMRRNLGALPQFVISADIRKKFGSLEMK